MPIRQGAVSLRDIQPQQDSLFRRLGEAFGVVKPNFDLENPSHQAQLASIQKGIITGDFQDEDIGAFVQANPETMPFIAEAVQRRNLLRQNFDPSAGDTGPLANAMIAAGDIETARKIQPEQTPTSSRYKFGGTTTDGRIMALDTQTNQVVVFQNPQGVSMDRPMYSVEQLTPEGGQTRTFGPRGAFIPQGVQTVKTAQSPTEKAAFEQRGARGVITQARNLVNALWTAEGGISSRLKQAAELKKKEFTQSDPRVAQYNSLREGFLAPIIRALGEKGTLAEGDIGRARELWPSFTDSKEVALSKLNQVEKIFDGVLSGKFDSLSQAISETATKSTKDMSNEELFKTVIGK